MEPEPLYPVIRTTADLCRVWQIVLEEQGSDERTLWIGYLDPRGLRRPAVVGIDEMPPRPTAGETLHLRELLDHFADTAAATPYLMFSRTGGRGVTASDREWAAVIRELQRGLGVDRPVLRGVGSDVVVLPE